MQLGELELGTAGSILGEPNTSETNGRLFESFQGEAPSVASFETDLGRNW